MDLESGRTHKNWGVGFEQGDSSVSFIAPASLERCIGDDVALWPLEEYTFSEGRDIPRSQPRLEVVREIDDQAVMNPGPKLRIFKIGVHPGKDHGHGLGLPRGASRPGYVHCRIRP